MKNVIKLQHYYSPTELQQAIAEWVEYYNNQRYHEALKNVTPADVYFGRDKEVIRKRNRLKEQTLDLRRQQLGVRSLLDDLAIVNDHDLIRLCDGRKAMRDHEKKGLPLQEAPSFVYSSTNFI
ncbi:MAG TPA: IS3 family transposase [Anaerolineales bacterium]|nr:IS3 family transposase [Anaerolineales bacterium]